MTMRWIGAGIVVLWLTACGGDATGSSTSSSGSTGAPPTSGESSSGAPAEQDAGAEPAPQAAGPKMKSVVKMTGSLHVTWELPEKCDGVELERKDGDTAFDLAYELPGFVDNKHDGSATKDLTYTYRARCKIGSEYTAYSDEMANNPQK